ncbi:hypothetical protein GBZ26_22325 [Azospirillum formosense]|uniref:Uncharacterized protein n=1 Tax=Azospirillum formosense TaxID=861533 RepID=A0ABX2L1S9_9PROT|nr:hypothetical protein [Azospirillum formosense]MBY3755049.1 hypothetical protein [Azospirillum formosense]NUB21912.1 hypothetical protein [Azospirillum formosense]
MVGSRGWMVAGAPITMEKYYANASGAMKILRCAWDPALLGAVTQGEAQAPYEQVCVPDRIPLGEAMSMGMPKTLMVASALAFLVTVTS